MNATNLEEVLKDLFHRNLTHSEIQGMLNIKYKTIIQNNINLSMTTIKRKLAALNLKRKNYEAEEDLEYFVAAVIEELYSSGYII